MFIRTESFKDFLRFYPIISVILAINIALWLVTSLLPIPVGRVIWQLGVGVNALVGQGEYWRLVTPVFLHGGLFHLLFNSFALVLFGPALEQMLGKFKFIAAYLLTGIAGNFFTYFLDPNAFYPHLGASGAIYGLFGLYAYMVWFRKDLIDPASAQIVIVILVIGLLMTFLRPGINVAAHIFGLISGLALGPVILHNTKPFSPWRSVRKRKRPSDNEIGFNLDRWSKKRYPVKKAVVSLLWGFLILLIALGVLSRFL